MRQTVYPSSGTTGGAAVSVDLSNGKTIYVQFTTEFKHLALQREVRSACLRLRVRQLRPVLRSRSTSSSSRCRVNRPANLSPLRFYSDGAATLRGSQQCQRAGYDVSTDMSWNCGLLNTISTPDNSKSYQDVITLTGTTATGQVVAPSSTTMSVTGTQNASNPSSYSGDLTSGL